MMMDHEVWIIQKERGNRLTECCRSAKFGIEHVFECVATFNGPYHRSEIFDVDVKVIFLEVAVPRKVGKPEFLQVCYCRRESQSVSNKYRNVS